MDILNDILLYSDIEEIMDFIRYFWFHNRYSVYNCLLIYAQRPGAVMLGTAKQWLSRNRFIISSNKNTMINHNSTRNTIKP